MTYNFYFYILIICKQKSKIENIKDFDFEYEDFYFTIHLKNFIYVVFFVLEYCNV